MPISASHTLSLGATITPIGPTIDGTFRSNLQKVGGMADGNALTAIKIKPAINAPVGAFSDIYVSFSPMLGAYRTGPTIGNEYVSTLPNGASLGYSVDGQYIGSDVAGQQIRGLLVTNDSPSNIYGYDIFAVNISSSVGVNNVMVLNPGEAVFFKGYSGGSVGNQDVSGLFSNGFNPPNYVQVYTQQSASGESFTPNAELNCAAVLYKPGLA